MHTKWLRGRRWLGDEHGQHEATATGDWRPSAPHSTRLDLMPTMESGSDRMGSPSSQFTAPFTRSRMRPFGYVSVLSPLFVISFGCGLLSAVGICHIATVASTWMTGNAMRCKSVAGWGKRKSCQFKWVQPAFWHLSLSWTPNVASVWLPLRDPQTAWRREHRRQLEDHPQDTHKKSF